MLVAALLLAGCGGYEQHLEQGDVHSQAGRYEEALAEYEAARKADADAPEAKQKITATLEKLRGIWLEAGRGALAAGRLTDAIEVAGKLHAKLPDDPETGKLVGEVATASDTAAEASAAAGDYAGGAALYDAVAEKLPPERARATERSQALRERWAKAVDAEADEAERGGLPGRALLLRCRSVAIADEAARRARRDALRARLAAEWTYAVQIDRKARGLGVAEVIGQLGAGGPALVEIIPAGKTTRPVGATLSLSLRGPKFTTDRATRTERARYQSGTRQVPNPFYQTRQNEVTRREGEVLRRQEEADRQQQYVEKYTADVQREGPSPNVSTGAEQNLSNAQSRLEAARRGLEDDRRQVQQAKETLSRTEQFTEEPVFDELSYTVTTHRRTGTLDLTGAVRNADKRPEIAVADALREEASDETHPAQPTAKVAEDPLVLPDEGEVTARLYGQAAARVRATIDESFAGHRAAHLERARAAATDAEKVDGLAIYVLMNPSDVPPEVAASLASLSQVPDTAALLGPGGESR